MYTKEKAIVGNGLSDQKVGLEEYNVMTDQQDKATRAHLGE
jgi:hypothetical protein